MEESILNKIMEKREFSELPRMDVEKTFSKFSNRQVSDKEKVRLTREHLHKVFSAFGSKKLLSPKNKTPEWFLRKHLSTRERIGFYEKIYSRLIGKEKVVFDLGSGINGFSYEHFPKKVKYISFEAVGQWVDLMNEYFKENKFDAIAIHKSLFDLDSIKLLIDKERGQKIIFLFKVLDSLEMAESDYSKKLLKEVTPLASKVVVSFPTESMIRRKRFRSNRRWIVEFIKDNFELIEDFKLGSERFIVFSKKKM